MHKHIPPKGTSPQIWLKKLIEIACNAFYLGEGVSYLLQDAINAAYEKYGLYDGTGTTSYPTMKDVLVELQATKVKGRKAMWMDSALRALQTLCFGPISDVINVTRNESLEDVLNQYAILELDALANAEKIFFIEALMVWIHHYRMKERKREVFKHCMIVEEAHNILHPTEKDDVVNTLMREIREFGESIVLVDQHPSQMSIPAMGNTHCTIALNVKHNKDIQALADAMQVQLKDRGLFGQLNTGKAVVKLQSRFMQPFLIKVPKVDIKKGAMTDLRLKQLFARDSIDSAATGKGKEDTTCSPPVPANHREESDASIHVLNETELRLMKDIIQHPFDGVVRRYSRLDISRRRGNAARENLVNKGALVAVPVTIKQGKKVLLEPSPQMKTSLQRIGGMTFSNKDGGIVHQYWKQKIGEEFGKHGWRTEEEKSIGNGQQVDVHAERNGRRVAVEVETGQRGIANIQKALQAGYEKVISFATEGFKVADLRRKLSEKDIPSDRVILMTPNDWNERIKEISETDAHKTERLK